MPAGIFFVVIGGWLLSRWTYSSSAFGLVNGRYVFWLRLNVTSRKLIICLLASMVMRSPLLLKMRHISFLMFSVSLGEALVMAVKSLVKNFSDYKERSFDLQHRIDVGANKPKLKN